MFAWTQPALPFDEPVTVLPRDGRARMIFAWRGTSGRLDRRWAAEVDDVQTVRHLLREQPDVYETQWWMDRPIHKHAFALCGTHAYADLDFYKVPALADQPPDAIGRALLRYCDDTGLPRPSAIIGSGRGLYPKWCFAEPIGREHLGTTVSLGRELTCRLAPFGADRTATDAATRLLRATGTLHSGAGRMVEVLHLEQSDGRTITYDAHALADRLVPRAADAPAVGMVLATADDANREARRDHRAARHRFTREGWHWALIEDMRELPAIRWHGIVPEGWRDTFAFLIACQLVRIFPPGVVFGEIVAIVSTIVDADFVRRHLLRLCSSAMRLARDAHAGRSWIHTYRFGKQTMIDLLQITPAEQRHMRALIDEAEYRCRHAARERARRAAAGALSHADRAERQATARVLKAEGLSWAEIAERMALPSADAARKLAARA